MPVHWRGSKPWLDVTTTGLWDGRENVFEAEIIYHANGIPDVLS